ncbi:MAG: nucleoside triphosphate pyrophosphohydrolase [Candidatus Aminicenantes bacterium]|uniref:Nucleoside triphosphate pyrophosphohydrolase MazG n=1 Tax=Candidatus Saccharicenans subterraneus TaxID=2508984 RepID=A0A3E2BJK5_9BACT|nr:nucleoside triphosphate pyrophosphohydrolase [Candidatus Aminicenantes bacterium]RFT14842.1 MAG: Nucleoside triphosphate pyrophosphohydrolase MazG [Candidatus Saccharicenans subterraneum]
MKSSTEAGREFRKLVEIIARLRSPGGCPWDRARSRRDILNYFLEEVYEAVEAISSNRPEAAREELGDVLMEVVFLARFYEEEGLFTMADVLRGINRKMVERHPHVFGRKTGLSPEAVLASWQENKLREKKRRSILDGLPASAPSLVYAFMLGQRAAAHGFDWPEAGSALEKVKEEIAELDKSLKKKKNRQVAEELGDTIFSLVNVCRLLGYNPEIVLRQAGRKFERRFRQLEKELKKKGREVRDCSLEELDRVWEAVKKNKRAGRKNIEKNHGGKPRRKKKS